MKKLIILFLAAISLASCGTTGLGGEATSAYNMTQCKYEYKSISGVSLDGMDFSKGLSPLYIPKITALLMGGSKSSLPINFMLNMNINNPNATAAMLHGLSYIISVDNVDFTSGVVNQDINVPANGSQLLPVNVGFDLATLLTGSSKDAATNMAKNLIGLGGNKSNVTIKIKPTFMIAGIPITYPSYIPVNFSFGGR